MLGLQVAHAGSVIGDGSSDVDTTGGVRQGYLGDHVSLSVSESNLTGFLGAALTFTFDSTVLDFTGVLHSDSECIAGAPPALICGSQFSLGAGKVSLFLLTSLAEVNGPAELFTLLFDIKPTATLGETGISFSNDSAGNYSPGEYDRDAFTGRITVLPRGGSTDIPIVGSDLLALTALALLALVGRARRARAESSRFFTACLGNC
jgi:hypothetical protein